MLGQRSCVLHAALLRLYDDFGHRRTASPGRTAPIYRAAISSVHQSPSGALFRLLILPLGYPQALEKTGSVLGNSPLRVLPSKTAIMPVNQELMPRSADEVERCSRTVYAANIDKKVDKNDVRAFFESLCGGWGLEL